MRSKISQIREDYSCESGSDSPDWRISLAGSRLILSRTPQDLPEIVEARNRKMSTIFCFQFDAAGCYLKIGEPAVADAVCDRIVNDSCTVKTGDSMQKRTGLCGIFTVGRNEKKIRQYFADQLDEEHLQDQISRKNTIARSRVTGKDTESKLFLRQLCLLFFS